MKRQLCSLSCSLVASLSLANGSSGWASPEFIQSSDAPLEPTSQQLPLNSPTAPPSPSRPAVSVNPSSYLLGPGDELAISIIGYPEFDDMHLILADGSISLPLIGSVQASGYTLDSLSTVLTQRLGRYLVNPVIALKLQSMRPIWVTVGGEVTRPGPRQLSAQSGSNQSETIPNLTSALTAAGGVTREADIRQITIQRIRADTTTTFTVDLWDSLGTPGRATEWVLQDGDVIWVPELAVSDDQVDPNLIARSTLAPETVRVRVVGEVKRPGEVEVPPYSSLSSAVAVAGGPTRDAKLGNVGLVRMDENGEVSAETIDLSDLSDSYQVQEGDVIVVPKTGIAIGLDYIARLLLPFNFLIDLFD